MTFTDFTHFCYFFKATIIFKDFSSQQLDLMTFQGAYEPCLNVIISGIDN